MNKGTSIMVVAALLLAGGAYSMRPAEVVPTQFEDTGEPLFKDFTDPTLAAGLEVVMWDEGAAKVNRFAVEMKNGRWVIPSHNDYPADGTERMGRAASSFIDVKKDIYYGDDPEQHGSYGLLDPEGTDGKGEERGKRIVIRDASGTVLVDVLVGKEIENKSGMFYVRYPGEKRVYGSTIDLDVSTSFGDWIEKDLLQVKSSDVVRVEYDPYKVDETKGMVTNRKPVVATLESVDGSDKWMPAEGVSVPAGKELNTSKLRSMVSSISNVKIVGVRPRPERLTRLDLQPKGFFVNQEGTQLFGNEGQVSVVTKQGVVYTLYFGEVTYESGIALTSGRAADKSADEDANKGKNEQDNEAADAETDSGEEKPANRYMFVDVFYEPSLDQDAKSKDADETKDDEADAASSEAKSEETGSTDDAVESEGSKTAEKLAKRFQSWFYVISESSFKQIHKDRDELFSDRKNDD